MNARSVDATRQAFFEFDSSFESRKLPQPVQLTMSRARQIETQVVASDGKPVAGALIGAIGGAVPGWDLATGRTDDNGHGTLLIPADAPLRHVYAFKSGMGLDYVACNSDPEESAVTADRSSLPEAGRALVFTLRGAKTARIRLVDPEGRPLPGIDVYPWYFTKQPTGQSDLNVNGASAVFGVKTDVQGVAVFDWLPTWHMHDFFFWPHGGQQWARNRIVWNSEQDGLEKTVALPRTVPVRGQVLRADGQPRLAFSFGCRASANSPTASAARPGPTTLAASRSAFILI